MDGVLIVGVVHCQQSFLTTFPVNFQAPYLRSRARSIATANVVTLSESRHGTELPPNRGRLRRPAEA